MKINAMIGYKAIFLFINLLYSLFFLFFLECWRRYGSVFFIIIAVNVFI